MEDTFSWNKCQVNHKNIRDFAITVNLNALKLCEQRIAGEIQSILVEFIGRRGNILLSRLLLLKIIIIY